MYLVGPVGNSDRGFDIEHIKRACPVTLAEVASAAREVAAAARGSPFARKAWLVAAYLDAVLNPMSGDELCELRCLADLSQAEFAEQLGVSQPTVSDMERDRRPVTVQAALLARALARTSSAARHVSSCCRRVRQQCSLTLTARLARASIERFAVMETNSGAAAAMRPPATISLSRPISRSRATHVGMQRELGIESRFLEPGEI